jgi:hypothetical protein
MELIYESIWSWTFLYWETITASTSFFIIDLFRWLYISLSSRPYVSRNLSGSSRFSTLFENKFSKYFLVILWISLTFVAIVTYSYLILLSWVFSLSLLLSFTKDLLILFLFKELPFFIDFLVIRLVSSLLIFILISIIYFYLLVWDLACSCFSKSLWFIISLFEICDVLT